MTDALRFATTAIMLACFASFAWAIAQHFKRSADPKPVMRILQICGVVGAGVQIVSLWIGSRECWSIGIGLSLLVSALSLFWWATMATRRTRLPLAFDPSHADEIISSGPYAFIRHPFYVSYALAWFGGALAGSNWWGWAPTVSLTPLYVAMAIGEERKLLNAPPPIGLDFLRYRSRTGMFFPLIGRKVDHTVTSPSREVDSTTP